MTENDISKEVLEEKKRLEAAYMPLLDAIEFDIKQAEIDLAMHSISQEVYDQKMHDIYQKLEQLRLQLSPLQPSLNIIDVLKGRAKFGLPKRNS